MSFLPLNNQDNQYAPAGQTTNNPAGGVPPQTGGSAGAPAGGTAPKSSTSGTPTQFGSSASKLGDYLSANAPQVQNQADKLAGNLNTQYGQLQGGIQNAANQFGQQVQGGYAAPNQQLIGQAIANPSQFASNPENVKAFQAQYNNQYTGPQNFEGFQPYSQIQGDVQNAVQQGGLLGTQAGLQSYLQNQGQGKNPTSASSTLDALLMRGNPTAQQTIQNAAGQFNNLTGQLESARNTGNQSVQDAQKAAQDAATYAQNAINPVAQATNTDLANRLQTVQGQTQKYNQDVDKNQQLTTALNQMLANGPSTWGSVPNYSLSDWAQNLGNPLAQYTNFNPINQTPTEANIANTQDYATQAALSQLMGGNFNPTLNQADIGQAGTFNIPNGLPTTSDITGSVGNWLQNTEIPQYQAANQALNAIGRDVAYSGAAQQQNKQQQFLNSLRSVDPDLAAYLGA